MNLYQALKPLDKTKMKLNKRNAGIGSGAMKIVYAFLGVAILMQAAAVAFPTMTSAGTTLQSSGVSFATFFGSGGLLFVIISVGLLASIIKQSGMGGK